MKKRIIISLVAQLFLCGMTKAFAQKLDTIQSITNDSILFNEDEFKDLALPPLEVLYQNAAKSPDIRLSDLRIKEQKLLLSKEKRAWSTYFSLGSGYFHGNMGMFSSYSDATTPLMSQYSGQTTNNWQVGASFNISLESFLDLLPRVKRQQVAVEIAEAQRDVVIDQLHTSIVELYVLAKLQISLLKLQAQALIYANAMFKMLEQDFLNGQKDQSDISVGKSIQSKAQESYEGSKSTLMNSLLRLEILTKTSIVTRKTTK